MELGEQFTTETHAAVELFVHIQNIFNEKRQHSTLNYQTPAAYERATAMAKSS